MNIQDADLAPLTLNLSIIEKRASSAIRRASHALLGSRVVISAGRARQTHSFEPIVILIRQPTIRSALLLGDV